MNELYTELTQRLQVLDATAETMKRLGQTSIVVAVLIDLTLASVTNTDKDLQTFYKELLKREKLLKSKPKTQYIRGKLYELQLIIIRTQQLLLNKLSK